MTKDERRTALSEFLKSKRESISPAQIGLKRNQGRAKGLRREEVAAFAGVGLTWYTWLEQGREIKPSAALLARLSHTLQMDSGEEAYLFALAGVTHAQNISSASRLPPEIGCLMANHRGPAAVIDGMFDMIHVNAAGSTLWQTPAVKGLQPRDDAFACNHLWQMFMNPRVKAIYKNFDVDARRLVAAFRLSSTPFATTERFTSFISQLQDISPDFKRMWHELSAALITPITVELIHPTLGELRVHSVRFPLEMAGNCFLVLIVPSDAATRSSFLKFPHGEDAVEP